MNNPHGQCALAWGAGVQFLVFLQNSPHHLAVASKKYVNSTKQALTISTDRCHHRYYLPFHSPKNIYLSLWSSINIIHSSLFLHKHYLPFCSSMNSIYPSVLPWTIFTLLFFHEQYSPSVLPFLFSNECYLKGWEPEWTNSQTLSWTPPPNLGITLCFKS